MSNKKQIAILQTTLLLLDGVTEFEILKLDLAPHLKKAKEIITIIK